MQVSTKRFVAVTYSTPVSELTAQGKAACERLESVIHQAIEDFHDEIGAPGLAEIELYPCPADCKDCIAAARDAG